MKEHSIIMSSDSVQAILAGRKTQTRRVIWPQPLGYDPSLNADGMWEFCDDRDPDPCHFHRCLYGGPGDRLWVQETWRIGGIRDDGRVAIDYRATPDITHTPWCWPPMDVFSELAQQTWKDAETKGILQWNAGESPARWRSATHMPHWASRITLEIADVRVEHLQDISDADAVAEGTEVTHGFDGSLKYVSYPDPKDHGVSYLELDARTPFSFRWDELNAKRGFGWDNDPWVWVLMFRLAEEEKTRHGN